MTTPVIGNSGTINVSAVIRDEPIASAKADTTKAPGDAGSRNVDIVVRPKSIEIWGNAICAGIVMPPILFGAVSAGVEAGSYVSGIPGAGEALLLTGAITALFGAIRLGLAQRAHDAKAAIAAVTNVAADTVGRASDRLSLATGLALSAAIAFDVAGAPQLIADPVTGLFLLGVASAVAMAATNIVAGAASALTKLASRRR